MPDFALAADVANRLVPATGTDDYILRRTGTAAGAFAWEAETPQVPIIVRDGVGAGSTELSAAASTFRFAGPGVTAALTTTSDPTQTHDVTLTVPFDGSYTGLTGAPTVNTLQRIYVSWNGADGDPTSSSGTPPIGPSEPIATRKGNTTATAWNATDSRWEFSNAATRATAT